MILHDAKERELHKLHMKYYIIKITILLKFDNDSINLSDYFIYSLFALYLMKKKLLISVFNKTNILEKYCSDYRGHQLNIDDDLNR